MAIPKYLGTETEYGISVIGRPDVNPVLASSLVVNAYSDVSSDHARWDHSDEDPLRDARGFTQEGLVDPGDEDLGLANVVLINGARFYVDHAHPEYSSPECASPRDAVVWDKAGERILERAAARASAAVPTDDGGASPARVLITKNNTDGKGAAYGTHENYLVDRALPFGELVRQIIPFFTSRQVMVGAGRIGNEFSLDDVGYQIAQRSDFFEVEVGLETTLKRPLVNTRDEPHADPERYRRLHVILGDANMSEVCTYLKLGATALVLAMAEDGHLPPPPALSTPVRSLHELSHDLTCTRSVELADGTRATAVDLQRHYLDLARRYVAAGRAPGWAAEVCATWERVLDQLAVDPLGLDGVVDWVTKHQLLARYVDRDGIDWSHDKLKLIDVQYHDVRTDRGLYNRLVAAGRIETLVSEDEIQRAIGLPPEDTRAWFRGRCLDKYRGEVAAAAWDALVFDVGAETLQRVPMMEPGRGTRAAVGALIDASPTAKDLLEALRA